MIIRLFIHKKVRMTRYSSAQPYGMDNRVGGNHCGSLEPPPAARASAFITRDAIPTLGTLDTYVCSSLNTLSSSLSTRP